MAEKIQYTKGEIINGLIFIQEDFHELEVLGKQRYRRAVFQCHCGEKFITRINTVKSGKAKSCGCERRKKLKKRITRHGGSYKPEYTTWESMKSRCLCKTNKFYNVYGGRGITISDEWITDFKKFYEDMGPKPSPSHSIDRINVNGNYCKENCRWEIRYNQDRNRTDNIFITYNGEKLIVADWAKKLGLHAQTIKDRLNRGLSIEECFNTNYNYNKKK